MNTGSARKDAAYCTRVAKDAIIEIEEEFRCTVAGVVTDNERKMQKMRENLKERDPDLTVYSCSSHQLNLLGGDITISAIVNQVVEVNKHFRNHHKPTALLTACAGSVKPVLPCATRWNSQLECLSSYVTNRPFMCTIVNDDENAIDAHITKIVNNVGLFREVKNHIEQFHPIARALDRAQSDSATLADTCEDWLDLLESPNLAVFNSQIKKRFNQAMTPAHFLANLLDPKYLGAKLSPEQKEKGKEVLDSYSEDLVPLTYQLAAKLEPFPVRMFGPSFGNMKSSAWYQCLKGETRDPNMLRLCDLAAKLLSMPPSSASVERVFSNFAVVQNKLRNRLGVDKAGKLVTCFRALRSGIDSEDW